MYNLPEYAIIPQRTMAFPFGQVCPELGMPFFYPKHWKGAEDMENFTEGTAPQGLYDPRFEHDNCGIGAVVDARTCEAYDAEPQGEAFSPG